MGTPDFAVPSLNILVDHHYAIPAVVTAPDKPRGRGQEVSAAPVKRLALRHGLPVLQPASLKEPRFADHLRTLQPDLFVVAAFRILPREIFGVPRLGAFNLHASLLPKYRGAAPINWAIINGEEETGVTTFFLQEKVDTGGIILQARLPIRPDDDAGTLHDRLAEVGAELVLHTVRLIEQGKVVPHLQDDSLATPAPKIFKDDCRIRWDQPARGIHNLVRGLSPSPAAFTFHGERLLKIYRTHVLESAARGDAGEVTVTGDSLLIATGAGSIAIAEIQQEGRNRMSTAEFLRGYRLITGDRFT